MGHLQLAVRSMTISKVLTNRILNDTAANVNLDEDQKVFKEINKSLHWLSNNN